MKKTFLLILVLLLALQGAALAEEKETLTFGSVTVEKDAEILDMGKRQVYDWDGFFALLDQMPNLKQVDMYGTVPNPKILAQLEERYPDVEFGMTLRYGRYRMRTDDTAFSTLYVGEVDGNRKFSYDEIAMLRICKNLYALDIGHHPVKKLDFLYDLPELRVLIVAICDLTDITPIASLKHLEYLEIFHNRIEDISCLSDLPYLMDLNLVKNNVSDLTPLMNLKSLRRLWIFKCNQADLTYPDADTLARLQEALPDCHIDAESTSTAGGWRKDPHYTVISRMFQTRVYEPFEDSNPDNLPPLLAADTDY